ncbi:MAG: hypothetical protein JJ916_03355 [Phycisphaerales bacterium]|nr:hypothetical protein [Phycisphaerales bacterium]
MPDRPWKDEYTLLCEKCGYVIEGLDQSGNCPECGKAIADSLPERRVGTPWQQSPGVGSLVRTWLMTLRHPLRTLDVMRINEREGTGLALKTLFTAGLWMYIVICLIEMMNPYSLLGFLGTLGASAIGTPIVIVALIILTTIELSGLIVISRSRGFRITEPIADNIVSHGSVGWVWCGAFIALSLYCYGQSMMPSEELFRLPPWNAQPNISGYGLADHYGFMSLIFLLMSIPGFLFFETFAYLGLRRCKYANRVRPEP